MSPSHMISVIIPTYNEATYLPATLDSVADSNANKEVIVVDAGSADGTHDVARARAARVLLSQRRQRAYQMNLGARHAHGAVLLFLHADTVLPTAALDHIALSLSENRIVGGGFAYVGFEASQNVAVSGIADASQQMYMRGRRRARRGIFCLKVQHFDFQPIRAREHREIRADVMQSRVRANLLHRQVL